MQYGLCVSVNEIEQNQTIEKPRVGISEAPGFYTER